MQIPRDANVVAVSRCEQCGEAFHYPLQGKLHPEHAITEGVFVNGRWVHKKCEEK